MKLKDLKSVDFDHKNILIRVDFNVSVVEGRASDVYKIEAVKETVDYIKSFADSKIALATHLGRPKDKNDEKFSVKNIIDDVERVLGYKVIFVEDCLSEDIPNILEKLKDNEIVLLENLRFYKEEKKNDQRFAEKLAKPFDIYINEAFSVCHRKHASVYAISDYLPHFAGIRLEKEVQVLTKVKNPKEYPCVAIIGGAKIETKLPLITSFENKYDNVLVGGRVSIEAQDEGIKFSDKVILPIDYAENKFDIGPKTIETFVSFIEKAKTIVWNGPLGKFEEKPFDIGTVSIAEAISKNKKAFSVVGGGESIQALNQTGNFDKISFVSTGGGAMLAFLSGDKMPGLDVLEEDLSCLSCCCGG